MYLATEISEGVDLTRVIVTVITILGGGAVAGLIKYFHAHYVRRKEKEDAVDSRQTLTEIQLAVAKDEIASLTAKMNIVTETVLISGKPHFFSFFDFLSKASSLNAMANKLIESSDVDRVSIFMGTNGNSDIKVVRLPLQYLDDHVEETKASKESRDNYNGIAVESQYRDMISSLWHLPFIDYNPKDKVNEGKQLTTYYRQEKVLLSRIRKIGHEEHDGAVAKYYISLASHIADAWSDNDLYHIDIFCSQLDAFFKNWTREETKD